MSYIVKEICTEASNLMEDEHKKLNKKGIAKKIDNELQRLVGNVGICLKNCLNNISGYLTPLTGLEIDTSELEVKDLVVESNLLSLITDRIYAYWKTFWEKKREEILKKVVERVRKKYGLTKLFVDFYDPNPIIPQTSVGLIRETSVWRYTLKRPRGLEFRYCTYLEIEVKESVSRQERKVFAWMVRKRTEKGLLRKDSPWRWGEREDEVGLAYELGLNVIKLGPNWALVQTMFIPGVPIYSEVWEVYNEALEKLYGVKPKS